MQLLYRILRSALYWGLPPLILYLIFRQLDLAHLLELGRSASPWLIAFGGVLIIPRILAGALRWHGLARGYDCTRLTWGQSFREYWFSLALGVFTPGFLGSDVYRIALGGRQTGLYLQNAFVIGVERGAALLSCVALITAVYPFLTLARLPAEFEAAVSLAYLAGLLGVVLLVFLALTHRSEWLRKLGGALWQRIGRLATRAVKALPGGHVRGDTRSVGPSELTRPLFSARIALPAILLSLIMHVIGAVQGQLFLRALGYDLSFLANLFIAPLLVLVLTLPVTVGGVGVREGAYVVFYGAFGVPAETALLVSFCNLLTMMVGNVTGTLVFLARKNGAPVMLNVPRRTDNKRD